MADSTYSTLRGLIFSAVELGQQHPDWSSEAIEDYLNIFNNFETISEAVDAITIPPHNELDLLDGGGVDEIKNESNHHYPQSAGSSPQETELGYSVNSRPKLVSILKQQV